ncbi:MAG: hypothetical protein ACI9Z7_001989, partial [Alteromonas macleodii]
TKLTESFRTVIIALASLFFLQEEELMISPRITTGKKYFAYFIMYNLWDKVK